VNADSSARLRVAFVVGDLQMGGAERHVVMTAAALARMEMSVVVLCVQGSGVQLRRLEAAGVAALVLGGGYRDLSAPISAMRLALRLRKLAPDIVITTGFHADVVGRCAAALAWVPVIASWKHVCEHIEPYRTRERRMERLCRLFTDEYFAVADEQARYMVKAIGVPSERIRVIHNGVVPARSRLERDGRVTPREEVTFGVVAMLREWKGHRDILTAFSMLVARTGRGRLVLVGDGPERAPLEEQAFRLGVLERVEFAGLREDVDAVLRGVDVLVLASHAVECFPYAVLEAMAQGIPAVCTDVGGLGEMVVDGHTGFLVRRGQPAALCVAMEKFVRDPMLIAEMGQAAAMRQRSLFTEGMAAQATFDQLKEAVMVVEDAPATRRPRRRAQGTRYRAGWRRRLRRRGE